MFDATQVTRSVEDAVAWCRERRWRVLSAVLLVLIARTWFTGDAPTESDRVDSHLGLTDKRSTAQDEKGGKTKDERLARLPERLASSDQKKVTRDQHLEGIRRAALTPEEKFISFDGPVVVPITDTTPEVTYILFRLNYLDASGSSAAKLLRIHPGGHWSDLGPAPTLEKAPIDRFKEFCAMFATLDSELRERNETPQPDPEAEEVDGVLIFHLNDHTKRIIGERAKAAIDQLKTITKIEAARIENFHRYSWAVRVHYISQDGSARRYLFQPNLAMPVNSSDPEAWNPIGTDDSGIADFMVFCQGLRQIWNSTVKPRSSPE